MSGAEKGTDSLPLRRHLEAVDKAADIRRADIAADDPVPVHQHVGVYGALPAVIVGNGKRVAGDGPVPVFGQIQPLLLLQVFLQLSLLHHLLKNMLLMIYFPFLFPLFI